MDVEAAVSFLRQLYPAGPWTLQALDPTGAQSMTGITFTADRADEMSEWIRTYNEADRCNIYFSINPGTHALQGNAEKYNRTQIRAVHYFQADLDPGKGDDREAGRAACLARLTTARPAEVPEPTFLIDSGNGYWGLWRLNDPLQLNGTIDWADAAAGYNRWLAVMLEADPAATDVSRIARLPGTINYPNAKKLAAGYTPVLARLLSFHDVGYDFTEFQKADAARPETISPSLPLPPREALPVFTEPDQLVQLGLREDAIATLVLGYHPNDQRWGAVNSPHADLSDEEKRVGIDRSELVFWVACEMHRLGLERNTIAAALLVEGWHGTAHIFAQPQPYAYAFRQVDRAETAVTAEPKKTAVPVAAAPAPPIATTVPASGAEGSGAPPENPNFTVHVEPMMGEQFDPGDHVGMLNFMNRKFALVQEYGGRTVVLHIDVFEKDSRLVTQRAQDIRLSYENQRVQIGEAPNAAGNLVPRLERGGLGAWWLKHPQRRGYRCVDFVVGDCPPDVLNLYLGFAVEPKEGDFSLYRDHLFTNICGENLEHMEYLLNWMARAVQYPGSHGGTAVVLRGKKGTGKSAFVNWFGTLWKPSHYFATSNSGMVIGNFTSHLEPVVVLFADEAFFAGDKRQEGMLKTLITEDTMTINQKYMDARTGANHLHIIMASNSEWVVPASGDERRYFVLDVSDARQQDTNYFEALRHQMENGGQAALLHFLLNRDISEFDHWKVPKTEALQTQMIESLPPEAAWWLSKLEDGEVLPGRGWMRVVTKKALRADYVEFLSDYRHSRGLDPTRLGLRLKEWGVEDTRMTLEGQGQMRCFAIPSLEEARKVWNGLFGARVWPEVTSVPFGANEGEDRPPF